MTPAEASSLAFWELLETVGWIAVILGCIGEGIAEFTEWPKDKERRHNLGKASWLILIAGLALEFWGSGRVTHIKDIYVGRLNKLAGEARERAAKFELELENVRAPRTIKPTQYSSFIKACEGLPNTPIKVFCGSPMDNEAVNYAHHVRQMLDEAGFRSNAGQDRDGIVFVPLLYARPIGVTTNYASLFFVAHDRSIFRNPPWPDIGHGRAWSYTNTVGEVRYIVARQDDTVALIKIFELIFDRIEVPARWWSGTDSSMTNILSPGEAAIFIPQKMR